MPLRKLTNAGDPLIDGGGRTLSGVAILFDLVDERGRPLLAFDTITGECVAPGQLSAQTDVDGLFEIDLWITQNLDKAAYWLCRVNIPDAVGFRAVVTTGDLPLTWLQFRAAGTPATPAQLDALALHIAETHEPLFAAAATALAAAVQTGQDVIATAADREQTGQDVIATAADRVQTGQDVIATAADRTAASNSEQNAAAYLDQMQTTFQTVVNSIGAPGTAGFGAGICPPAILPAGFTPIYGYTDPTHPHYGNYQYLDGSILVWVPKFYYRIAHADNPSYAVHGVNSVDVQSIRTFPTRAEAEGLGYALHRAFIDGGVIKDGFFVDKYLCSKRAKGTGFVASSIQGGLPLTTAANHNPIAEITASPANYHYSVVNAAKGRTGENGAFDAASGFFCCSLPIYAALALLSLAHGQAATSTTWCAWYSPAANYPKGNNNNALGDTNDPTMGWESDGYSNCGKTGSAGAGGGAGNLFAKSTHNGQDCGVADLAGNIFAIAIGMTCVAVSKAITMATQADPCVITAPGHGFSTGKLVQISDVGGMSQLNDKIYTVTVIDVDTFSIGVDSNTFTAYVAGGTAVSGTFYAAKESSAMMSFTAGDSLASDHWGAIGVAAQMEEISPPLNGNFGQLWGNAGNQVFDGATAGAGYQLTGFGLPMAVNSVSAAGTDLFGTDYFFRHVQDQLLVAVGGIWAYWTNAGIWCRHFYPCRSFSSADSSFRCGYYP